MIWFNSASNTFWSSCIVKLSRCWLQRVFQTISIFYVLRKFKVRWPGFRQQKLKENIPWKKQVENVCKFSHFFFIYISFADPFYVIWFNSASNTFWSSCTVKLSRCWLQRVFQTISIVYVLRKLNVRRRGFRQQEFSENIPWKKLVENVCKFSLIECKWVVFNYSMAHIQSKFKVSVELLPIQANFSFETACIFRHQRPWYFQLKREKKTFWERVWYLKVEVV